MLTRSRISRLASAGVLVLATATLSSCGFNYATDKVYTPAEGVNNRDSRVDVLNAAIVATEDGKGTFVASLSNNETPTLEDGQLTDVDDQLTGLAGVGDTTLTADLEPVDVPGGGLVKLADGDRHPGHRRQHQARRLRGGRADLRERRPGHHEDPGGGQQPRLRGPGRASARPRPSCPRATATSSSPTNSPRADPPGSDPMTYTLILLRHGESDWNAKNLFTGWVDVDLTDKGRAEAVRGGELLVEAGLLPDVVHTSLLRRAITHRAPRARRRRPALDPGAPLVAAQRAPLRRAAGQGQEADARGVRRGAVHALAPLVRHPAAAAGRRRRVLPGRRPALRRPRRRDARAPSASRTSSTRMLPYW